MNTGQCADCGRVKPLNDKGLCPTCSVMRGTGPNISANDTTARLPSGSGGTSVAGTRA